MVEYILKIDIDESDLVRKLNNALKKVRMPGVATGGSGSFQPSQGMAGNVFIGGKGAITEAGMRRVAEFTEKQQAFREGQENTLRIDNALKMHREDVRYQHSMEKLSRMQNNWTQKMFNVGTVVKLAGLASGVAGLLQMRKMIIDSSPMLQAMHKLLNVGIMFILRPIGDFFGFVMRPLFIPFVKFAVQFYASTLKFIPVWNKIGLGILAALNLDFATSKEYFQQATEEFEGLLKSSRKQEKDAAAPSVANEEGDFWDFLREGFDAFWKVSTGGILPNIFACPGGQTTTTDMTGDCLAAKTYEQSNKWFDSLTKVEENTYDINQSLHDLETIFDFQREKYGDYEAAVQEILCITKYGAPGAKGVAAKAGVSSLLNELEAQEALKDSLDVGSTLWKVTNDRIRDLNARISTSIEKYNNMINSQDNLSTVLTDLTGAINNPPAYVSPTSGWGSGGLGGGGGFGSYYGEGKWKGAGSKLYNTKEEAEANNPAGCMNIKQLAHGGLIEEEIWGVGQDTGKFYKLGEEGDEMVVPWKGNMVSSLARIGGSDYIASRQQAGGSVGQFTGVSAYKYKRAVEMLATAKDRLESRGERPGAPSTAGLSSSSSGARAHIRKIMAAWQQSVLDWEAKETSIGKLEDVLSEYQGITGMTPEQIQQSTNTYANTASTNNNSITINVEGANNADEIIANIGPKLLKYLQENEARVGIR